MQDIRNLSFQELQDILKEWKYPPFHARQIFSWIYKKEAADFDEMTDLSAALREKLKKNFSFSSLKLIKRLKSEDKTEKFLFELNDGNFIEAVNIPAEGRLTGCVSSQVGCKFSCRFCASGLLGFKRNLTIAEIIGQILCLKEAEGEQKLTHIVFMGIGEPLDNYDNVLKAIRTINSPEGLNIGARRITISTSGLIPGIKRLSTEGLQIELSVSLHAADDKTRSEIMPINKTYPLKDLISACRDYIQKTNRQITFEYVMIKGLNSDLPSATNLSRILKGLICKVNLIPVNPVEELGIEPPNKLEALYFKNNLIKQGINVTLRRSRGGDIMAACGQLRLKYDKK